MKFYNWIVIIVFVFLFGWCVIVNNKYNTLQQDYNTLKEDKECIIDSLEKENMKIQDSIKILEDTLEITNAKLSQISSKIEYVEKEEFVILTTFSESSNLLKKNLCAN